MQTHSPTEDFPDFPAHKQAWESFTRFMVRGIIGTAVTLLLLGWITGVL